MVYVITYIASGGDLELSCATAEEALPIVQGLTDHKVPGILVTNYEAGAQALETLRILVDHRRRTMEQTELA